MTSHLRLPVVLAAYIAFAGMPALAQTGPTEHDWAHGTSLSLFGGVASDTTHTGLAGGGSVGWELVPWFGIEGNAAWLDRGAQLGAFAADVTAIVSLTRPGPVVPFVDSGIGLYHASFEPNMSDMPGFYRRRMTAMEGPLRTSVAFTDPTVVVGGGVNVFVTGHAALRPEVQARVITGDSRTHTVTAFLLRVTYHLEDHPLTRTRGNSPRPAK